MHLLTSVFTFLYIFCVLGDFCYDPISIIADLLGGNTQDTFEYFATCVGYNPFLDFSTAITDALAELRIDCSFATAVSDTCLNTCNDLNTAVSSLNNDVSVNLEALMNPECEPYKNILLGFIEDSFCGTAYSGLFVMVILLLMLHTIYSRAYLYLSGYANSFARAACTAPCAAHPFYTITSMINIGH